MTREQAINYLISRGLTQEQVGDVVRALTYKPRDCVNCKHYVVTDTRTNWGSQGTTKIYGCERWECEYEPTTKNDLGVDCIDRTELLKAMDTWDKFGCDADTKLVQYQDHYIPYIHYDDVIKCIKSMPSVTPQEPRKGYWLHRPHVYGVTYCSICDFELKMDNTNFCPNCGAKMESEVDNGNDSI